MMREGRIARGDQRWFAELVGTCVRTLQLWAKDDPWAALPPLGRPAHSPQERRQALIAVAVEMIRQGAISGARPIDAALPGIPTRLVRESVASIKKQRAAHERREREEACVHVEVLFADAMWSQDATHLGRVEKGGELSGEVIRDVATTRRLAISAGEPSTAPDLVRLLEDRFEEHEVVPLVFASDNGTYKAEVFRCWLAEQGIVHLRNRPRTPQHNAWSEQGIGELKRESGLGRGVRIAFSQVAQRAPGPQRPITVRSQGPVWSQDLGVSTKIATSKSTPVPLERCRQLLGEAWWRLDHARLRASLGYRTAAQSYATAPRWYDRTSRESFWRAACLANALALAGCRRRRDEPMAGREAILRTMERVGLIRRTRGRRPLPAPKCEVIS